MKKGYFLVFSTAIISGFSIFINSFGVKIQDPYIFTFLKNIVAALFLIGFLFLLKDWKTIKHINKKQWGLLLTIGLVGGCIPFLLFFKGLSMTTAANGAFLQKMMFVYIALLAPIFLKEKISRKFLLGGLFLILGNLILLKKIPFSLNFGDFLIFVATLFWAVENIISKHVLKNLPGRAVAWARMFFGSSFIFIFLLATNRAAPLTTLTISQFNWALITGLLLFGYVSTWYGGLKHIPVSKASAILLLGSPITTLLSLIWMGKINFQESLAGVLFICGIISILGLNKIYQAAKKFKKLIYVRN
jgi:drug/metabolite transporter (DMT)-like permease